MKKLQKLTKIIQEANPELMELSFGCRVKNYGTEFIWHHLDSHTEGMNRALYENLQGTLLDVQIPNRAVEEFEILGHPITLEHVLVAIGDRDIQLGFAYLKEGILLMRQGFGTEKEPTDYVEWQLTKPPHEQSEEVINFLLEVLEKK